MVRAMAQSPKQKDLLTRLSDAGEEAISRVASSPTTSRLFESIGSIREGVDDLQRKVRGPGSLEEGVGGRETRVDELAKPKRATTSRSRGSTARKSTGASSPSTSPKT